MKNFTWLSVRHFTTFISVQEKTKAFFLLKTFYFSQFHGIMSGSSGMPTQAYQPFLYWTQEGPVRLSSLRRYVGNGAQSLSAFVSFKLSGMCSVSFNSVCTFLPFLLSSSSFSFFFFFGLVSKSQAKYGLLYSSLPFFCNIPATKQRLS